MKYMAYSVVILLYVNNVCGMYVVNTDDKPADITITYGSGDDAQVASETHEPYSVIRFTRTWHDKPFTKIALQHGNAIDLTTIPEDGLGFVLVKDAQLTLFPETNAEQVEKRVEILERFLNDKKTRNTSVEAEPAQEIQAAPVLAVITQPKQANKSDYVLAIKNGGLENHTVEVYYTGKADPYRITLLPGVGIAYPVWFKDGSRKRVIKEIHQDDGTVIDLTGKTYHQIGTTIVELHDRVRESKADDNE